MIDKDMIKKGYLTSEENAVKIEEIIKRHKTNKGYI